MSAREVAQSEDATKEEFQRYISEMRSSINLELKNLTSQFCGLRLRPVIEYALLSGGKRLRPIMAILCNQSVGGVRDEVIPIALAVELIHTASLIHDDVIDEDRIRRSVPALHTKWCDAIVVGDALASLAFKLAANQGSEFVKLMVDCVLELCDGQHMDVQATLDTCTEQDYFFKIKRKSASLFKLASQCGALTAGANSSQVRSLTTFGECFGMAYQIRDDLLDLVESSGNIPKDIKNRRVTLPIIRLYQDADLEKRETIRNFFLNTHGPTYPTMLTTLLVELERTKSYTYCKNMIKKYIEKATESILSLNDTRYKAYLIEMVRSMAIT